MHDPSGVEVVQAAGYITCCMHACMGVMLPRQDRRALTERKHRGSGELLSSPLCLQELFKVAKSKVLQAHDHGIILKTAMSWRHVARHAQASPNSTMPVQTACLNSIRTVVTAPWSLKMLEWEMAFMCCSSLRKAARTDLHDKGVNQEHKATNAQPHQGKVCSALL